MKKKRIAAQIFSWMKFPLIRILFITIGSLSSFVDETSAQAVANTITGTVKNETGDPVEGASVTVKGTQTGTTTNAQGNFSLAATRGNVTLAVSSVNYLPLEIRSGNGPMNIVLPSRVNDLDKVVVVGYGTRRARDITGAVGTVKGSQTVNEPARSVADILQSRVAGVEVVKNSGDPLGNTSIYIRGASSLNNPNPLYVIDGVPQGNPGNPFNTQDIESIDILKDASASSIYGAAAAGGVILITTKRGNKNGKTTVGFNSYVGITKPIIRKLLDRDRFFAAKENLGQDVTNGSDPSTLPNTDWVDAIFRNGVQQNYDLSVRGGGNNSNFYISGGYSNQTGNVIANYFKKYTFRINSDHAIGKRFKVGESVLIWQTNYSPVTSYGIPYRTRPDMAIYDSTNITGGGWGKGPQGFGGTNPVGLERSTIYTNSASAIEGNVYGSMNIIQGLVLKGVFGYSMQNDNTNRYVAAYDFGQVRNVVPTLEKASNNAKSLSGTVTLNYDRKFGKNSISALAGYEQRTQEYSNLSGRSDNLALTNTTSFFVTDNSNQFVYGGIDNRLLKSYFGRLGYIYDEKYIAEVSLRHDGDFYRFGPNNRYGNFPAASVGWKIDREPFMQNIPQISELKLRGSYGVVGNNNIPAYLFLARYSQIGAYTFSADGTRSLSYGINGIQNADIKWETTNEVNIGLDLGLSNNKFTLSIDYYDRKTKGILYDLGLPLSSGINYPLTTNVGIIQNKGFEFFATYQNKKGAWSYSVSANAAMNRNKILQLDGTSNNPIYATVADAGLIANQSISRSAVGRSLGEFYGLEADGIYDTEQKAEGGATVNGNKPHAGDLMFKDLNGDNVIDNNDFTYIGNPNPKLNYGVTLNLRYKWFDMVANFQGVAGVKLYNIYQGYNQIFFNDGNTTGDIFSTSFFGTNGLTGQPRVAYNDGTNYVNDPYNNYSRISSWFVKNGSYLKMRNLQVGVNIPASNLSLIHASSLRVFAMGTNLFSITKYNGLDPQVQAANVRSRGIDTPLNYPTTRSYSVGVNVTF